MKKNVSVSIAIFLKDISDQGFKVWTQIRLEKGALYGLKEFPGGKIEAGESPEEACRREVLEEVEITIPADSKLVLFKYQDYSVEHANICLYVYLSNFNQLPPDKGEWLDISFSSLSEPHTGKIPPINHVILDDLAVYIQTQQKAKVFDYLWEM